MTSVPLAHIGGGAFAPAQLLPLLAVGLAYYVRARTLARDGRPVPAWRRGCFGAGLALIVVALASPLAHVAGELFVVHMLEHLLIGDVATLLIVLGLTGPLLAPLLRNRAIDRLRVLGHPLVALPLWAANLYVWHVPALYQSAVAHPLVHALQHGLFIGLGIAVWLPLFGPLPRPAWFGTIAKLFYIVAVRLAGALLGNVLVWSGSVFYPRYAGGEAYWGVTALRDQGYAGIAMMIEGSLLTIGLFAWLFLDAARQGEERQRLLDYAAEHELELSDGRAERAVAAGREEELRRRLESAAGES